MTKRKTRTKLSNNFYLVALLVLAAAGFFTWKMVYAAGSVKYVALGDSITAGAQVESADTYVQKYANFISQDLHTNTTVVNLGVNGATSADLLNSLQNDQNFRTNVSSANVITLYIGFNDYHRGRLGYLHYTEFGSFCNGPQEDCMQNVIDDFVTNYTEIISTIKSLNTSEDTTIRTAIVYNAFVNLNEQEGESVYLRDYLEQLNTHITSISQANDLEVADLYSAINGPSHDEDGLETELLLQSQWGLPVHPSPEGHTQIAQAFKNLGYEQLDQDEDQVADAIDNCLDLANPDQANLNEEPILLPSPYAFSDLTNAIGDNVGDACDEDIDQDGLPNSQEISIGTNPNNLDSDGDSQSDNYEFLCGGNPTNPTIKVSNPSPDSDIDGISNSCEITFGTNPNIKDTDSDGIADGIELRGISSNPLSSDTDNDGCSDLIEIASLNNDKVVNVADRGLVSQKTGSRIGEPSYIRTFDVNGDGIINVADLGLVASAAGQKCL